MLKDSPREKDRPVSALIERVRSSISDRYVVEREVGQGGMATVYLARDVEHDRPVAVKVLSTDVSIVLGAERFRREIDVTTALVHPHILPILDSGQAGNSLYYVMPYVEGESLRARLDRERSLSIDDAIRITCEIGDALEYAHQHGIVHRDIKPEHSARRRSRGARRFRNRTRDGAGWRTTSHADGHIARHPDIHESRAGIGGARAGRPERRVQSCVRCVR